MEQSDLIVFFWAFVVIAVVCGIIGIVTMEKMRKEDPKRYAEEMKKTAEYRTRKNIETIFVNREIRGIIRDLKRK